MGSRYEVAVKLSSAKDLKNINWKYGPIRPYIVAWIDPDRRITSRVDEEGDTSPNWDQTLIVPLNCPIEDATLYLDVVHHASPDEDTKPLIGSAKLDLHEVVDEVGIGDPYACSLKFKRPSGRPHGKLKLEVTIREPQYRGSYNPYPAPQQVGYGEFREGHPYGQPPGTYGEPTPYGDQRYGQPADLTAAAYGEPTAYGDPRYGQPAEGYGHEYEHKEKEKKKSKFGGMGTGLAIGAAAGVVGGVALYAGYEHFKDDVAEEAAEKVEKDLDGDDDDDDDDDDEEEKEEEEEEEEEEEDDDDDDDNADEDDD